MMPATVTIKDIEACAANPDLQIEFVLTKVGDLYLPIAEIKNKVNGITVIHAYVASDTEYMAHSDATTLRTGLLDHFGNNVTVCMAAELETPVFH